MDNLRGRLGSTRKTKRGLGCDADSSTNFISAMASACKHTYRSELTGSPEGRFGNAERLAAVIEGSIPFLGLSDLSRSSISERFDARLHVAGTNDEENAGRYSNTDERHIGRQRFGLSLRTVGATSWSGDSMVYWPVSAPSNTAPHYYRNHGNPHIEKKARLRSQQIFFSRSRMGWLCADAHARDAAVAQRLHSATFGGGETRMQMRELQRSGGQ